MPPNDDIRRLTARYKAAIVDFNNKNGSSLESCRQELETLRWEERLPLVYRLRARALLTGDVIIGCWRGGEEGEEEEEEQHCLAAELQAYAGIGAGDSSCTTSGLEVEGRDAGIRSRVAGVRVVAPEELFGQQSRSDDTCRATRRGVVRGGMGAFAGFGSPAAEPMIELVRGDISPFGGFGNRAAEPTTQPPDDNSPRGPFGAFGSPGREPTAEPTQDHSTERRQATLHVLR
jgi:hypothetical protein